MIFWPFLAHVWSRKEGYLTNFSLLNRPFLAPTIWFLIARIFSIFVELVFTHSVYALFELNLIIFER